MYLYKNYELTDEVRMLSSNEELSVIYESEGVYLIKTGEEFGFMADTDVSNKKIVYSYSGGSGNSGSSGGSEWTDPVL